MTYDLLSIVLTLRPAAPAPGNQPVPAWWGRAAHALLLNLVGRSQPELAHELHDGDGPHPVTASTLMGRFPNKGLDPAGTYTLRLTAYEGRASAALWGAVQPDGGLSPGEMVELDYLPFRIEAAAWQPEAQPWAAATNFTELAARRLASAEEPPRQVGLQLTSPTAFKSGGKHLPLPLPELVFGSLLERWNAYSPVAFPAELRRYAAECLAVSRFELSSRAVPFKGASLRIGAVGQVTYTTLSYDRYWMSLVDTLSHFALFSGVGAGTGMGLGQCRRVGEREEG